MAIEIPRRPGDRPPPPREPAPDERDAVYRDRERRVDVPVNDFAASLRATTPYVWVTPALIAINVAVFLLQVTRGVPVMGADAEVLITWGANYPRLTLGGEWWRLV